MTTDLPELPEPPRGAGLPVLSVDRDGDIRAADNSLVFFYAGCHGLDLGAEIVRRCNGFAALTAERDRYRAELERIAAMPLRCVHVGRLTAEVRKVLAPAAGPDAGPVAAAGPVIRTTADVEPFR